MEKLMRARVVLITAAGVAALGALLFFDAQPASTAAKSSFVDPTASLINASNVRMGEGVFVKETKLLAAPVVMDCETVFQI